MDKIIRRKATNLSRRKFIVSSAAAGGGLAIGMHLPFGIDAARSGDARRREVNAWVVVKPDETCVIRIARSEMGQGTITGLAQLVTEELECDWNKVAVEFPTPGESHARKRAWGEFGTGGSRGIRTSEDYVRRGGAVARVMLLQAAADQWKVPASELTVANGRHHARRVGTHDHLRQGRGGRGQGDAAGPEEHQAQGPEGVEGRRQADEAARHGAEARTAASSTRSTSSCRAC